MSFDWSEFLNLARELAGVSGPSADVEARRRSSISRAYYSVYCQARDFAAPIPDFKPTGASKHQYLINWLKKSKRRDYKKFGSDLERLHEDRKHADYEPIVADLPTLSLKSIKAAVRALETLRSL